MSPLGSSAESPAEPSASSPPRGIHHVRLTVTDIARSKAFYTRLLGAGPATDFSDQADDPAVHQDPARLYGGCGFAMDGQILGLRPVATAGDRFESTRVGLDHLSLAVDSTADLKAIAARLDEDGVEHGELVELDSYGLVILSVQDPDDINLELSAPLERISPDADADADTDTDTDHDADPDHEEHTTPGTYSVPGQEFTRDSRYITDRITTDAEGAWGGWPVEAGRYRLIAARACPWAHRAIIVRRLLGLEDVLSMGLVGPTHDERSWTFDLDPGGRDPVLGFERLQQAYFTRDPAYPRGITVPAIVDTRSGPGFGAVVTNDFPSITLDLSTQWGAFHRDGAPDLYPSALREEIDAVARRVYTEVNNGVYRCGFAGSQSAYDDAYERLFATLDWLEERLGARRFLVGDTITEADVRLFTTLVRFDAVYHGHFKCNRTKLTEMPVLWAYARDLFAMPGFGDTVDFAQIKAHYYRVHRDLNPSGIVPQGPALAGWLIPSGRESLGGRPFGDGTPPGPVPPDELVPAAHGARA